MFSQLDFKRASRADGLPYHYRGRWILPNDGHPHGEQSLEDPLEAPPAWPAGRQTEQEAPHGTEQEAPLGTEQEAPLGTEQEAPHGTEQEAPHGTEHEEAHGLKEQGEQKHVGLLQFPIPININFINLSPNIFKLLLIYFLIT